MKQKSSIEAERRDFAIIGATASGKSELAFRKALEEGAYILSIDSLSVYREIDIVSAKISKSKREQVPHFGIDVINPDEKFDVFLFIDIYKHAKAQATNDGRRLIIVGGTSFYLKTLLTGISELPPKSEGTTKKVQSMLENLDEAYKFLQEIDPSYADRITKNDRYRIERGLMIYVETGISPTEWFRANPPVPIIDEIDIVNIQLPKSELHKRIERRTDRMIAEGLVDEVKYLIEKYQDNLVPIKGIGIRETLDYLRGKIKTISELKDIIALHTRQLAKRQNTFNRTQFKNQKVISLVGDELYLEKNIF